MIGIAVIAVDAAALAVDLTPQLIALVTKAGERCPRGVRQPAERGGNLRRCSRHSSRESMVISWPCLLPARGWGGSATARLGRSDLRGHNRRGSRFCGFGSLDELRRLDVGTRLSSGRAARPQLVTFRHFQTCALYPACTLCFISLVDPEDSQGLIGDAAGSQGWPLDLILPPDRLATTCRDFLGKAEVDQGGLQRQRSPHPLKLASGMAIIRSSRWQAAESATSCRSLSWSARLALAGLLRPAGLGGLRLRGLCLARCVVCCLRHGELHREGTGSTRAAVTGLTPLTPMARGGDGEPGVNLPGEAQVLAVSASLTIRRSMVVALRMVCASKSSGSSIKDRIDGERLLP